MTQRVTDGESNYHTYLAGIDNAVTLSPLACAIGPGAWLLPVVGGVTATTGSVFANRKPLRLCIGALRRYETIFCLLWHLLF